MALKSQPAGAVGRSEKQAVPSGNAAAPLVGENQSCDRFSGKQRTGYPKAKARCFVQAGNINRTQPDTVRDHKLVADPVLNGDIPINVRACANLGNFTLELSCTIYETPQHHI